MRVFDSERLDGVADAVLAAASVLGPLVSAAVDRVTGEEVGGGFAAATNFHQRDLFYVRSVLVSVGFNANYDVFLPADVWAARHTPVDKPTNVGHDREDIVGHTTDVVATNAAGDPLDMTAAAPPPDFRDLVDTSVVYLMRGNPEQSERVSDLVEDLAAGRLAVSMECLFDDFDYALHPGPMSRTDGAPGLSLADVVVVPRSAATAHLTKCLRVYNPKADNTCVVDGRGYYVGRVLRGITFAGKGFVANPANPNSLILEAGGGRVGRADAAPAGPADAAPADPVAYRGVDTTASSAPPPPESEPVNDTPAQPTTETTTPPAGPAAAGDATPPAATTTVTPPADGAAAAAAAALAADLEAARATNDRAAAEIARLTADLAAATAELTALRAAAAEAAAAARLAAVTTRARDVHAVDDQTAAAMAAALVGLTDDALEAYFATAAKPKAAPAKPAPPPAVATLTPERPPAGPAVTTAAERPPLSEVEQLALAAFHVFSTPKK